MWPARKSATLGANFPLREHIARFDSSGAVSLVGSDDLAALQPGLLQSIQEELGVEALAGRLCPVLLEDHSVAIFALAEHVGSDQADALAHRIAQHGYRLADPPRYVLAAPLLLAIVRKQITAQSLRHRVGPDTGQTRTALADAFQDMVEWGVRNGASDMHLNVKLGEAESEVRYTVNGHYLSPERFRRMPTTTLMDILAVAWMDIQGGNGAVFDPVVEQQGRLLRRVDGRSIVLRWASLAADQGPSVCLRLLEKDAGAACSNLAELGYVESQIDAIERAMLVDGGAIVFSGSVGSGKSTTLAALIATIPDHRKVITLEDPVEYVVGHAIQNTVGRNFQSDNSMAYASKLMTLKRSAMTDVLLGEIRDIETGRAFMDLVGAGINVYTSVHAPSAALVGERLASDFIGLSRHFLATPGILRLIVHQALLPRLCTHCALPASSLLQGGVDAMGQRRNAAYWENWLYQLESAYGRATDAMRIRNWHGCSRCQSAQLPQLNGYSGRIVAAECLEPQRAPGFLECLASGSMVAGPKAVRAGTATGFAVDDAVDKAYKGHIDPRDIEPRFGMFTVPDHAKAKAGTGLRAIA